MRGCLVGIAEDAIGFDCIQTQFPLAADQIRLPFPWGTGPALISRELALDLGDGSYAPAVVEHLPGAANDLTDMLSRRHDPAHQPWSLPSALRGVARA